MTVLDNKLEKNNAPFYLLFLAARSRDTLLPLRLLRIIEPGPRSEQMHEMPLPYYVPSQGENGFPLLLQTQQCITDNRETLVAAWVHSSARK